VSFENAQPTQAELYAQLTEPFTQTFTDPRGFTYVTGEQVVSRLNAVFGPLNWMFEIVADGYDSTSDEMWTHGRLSVFSDETGSWVKREQFGSQKVNRRRDDGKEIDYGFDKKGATTDCLKKCASLFGIGLYLSAKEEQRDPRGSPPARSVTTSTQPRPSVAAPPPEIKCEECGEPLKRVDFKTGDSWEPYMLANNGQSKFKKVLCMVHYRAYTDAAKASS
jgi:hypothetical protein